MDIVDMYPPQCEHGYPLRQAMAIAGEGWPVVERRMYGQTQMICPEHGDIVFTYDLSRALRWRADREIS